MCSCFCFILAFLLLFGFGCDIARCVRSIDRFYHRHCCVCRMYKVKSHTVHNINGYSLNQSIVVVAAAVMFFARSLNRFLSFSLFICFTRTHAHFYFHSNRSFPLSIIERYSITISRMRIPTTIAWKNPKTPSRNKMNE